MIWIALDRALNSTTVSSITVQRSHDQLI